MKKPETPEEWQEAVDAAYVMLAIDSARLYGFITGGPEIHVERCEEMLIEGRSRGVTPDPDAISRFLTAAFTCPVCDRVSYHPVDARVGWCSFCVRFTRGDTPEQLLAIAEQIGGEGNHDVAEAIRQRVRRQAVLS